LDDRNAACESSTNRRSSISGERPAERHTRWPCRSDAHIRCVGHADGGQTMKIGVFDSGVGGLTVLRALIHQLPSADYIYLGDTARLPYGSKSQATIARYAVSSARFLVEEGAEFLVIACNTASALALDAIKEAVRVPVLGVIETGANAAQAS